MAIDPETGRIYATRYNDPGDPGTIHVFDISDYSEIETHTIGGGAARIAMASSRRMYITQRFVDTVSLIDPFGVVVDATTNTLLETIAVGSAPWGVAIAP